MRRTEVQKWMSKYATDREQDLRERYLKSISKEVKLMDRFLVTNIRTGISHHSYFSRPSSGAAVTSTLTSPKSLDTRNEVF